MTRNKKILDVGCGVNKVKGAISIDRDKKVKPDIVHDLNKAPWPFKDNTFDEVYCNQILEHFPDLIKIMEEIHRISKRGCRVKIFVPYWSSEGAFRDPTHKSFFTEKTFEYFTEESCCNYYTKARFKVKKIELLWHKYVKPLTYIIPKRILKCFNNVIPNIYYELEVIKK